MNETTKTRHLSIYDFFEVLQTEYVVCELRVKIYPIQAHKEYWGNAAGKKKEKIIDIAKRNNLPSIFDDRRMREGVDRKIFKENGFPNFIYKDEAQRLRQEKWDLHNYYALNEEVKIIEGGKIIIATISKFYPDLNAVDVSIGSEIRTFNIDLVTRVL